MSWTVYQPKVGREEREREGEKERERKGKLCTVADSVACCELECVRLCICKYLHVHTMYMFGHTIFLIFSYDRIYLNEALISLQ